MEGNPSSSQVVPAIAPSLPSHVDIMQNWLRKEDWEVLTKAWEEAEAQAIAWAEGSDEEMPGVWEASQTSVTLSSPSQGSLPKLKNQRRRPQWDEDFWQLGNDHRKPQLLRRYFDSTPTQGTFSLPKSKRGEGHRSAVASTFEPSQSLKSRQPWISTWEQTVSLDNEALHPHLRHYFDRRGLESSYRNRPEVDRVTKRLRCRTPTRPSTRDRILKFRSSASEPSLSSGRQAQDMDPDTMHWGARCRLYNSAEYKVEPRSINGVKQKVPWVADHHVSVADDNKILHPALRHYFAEDGIESSFRNRGIHYGRPHRAIFGAVPGRKTSSENNSGSIHTSSVDNVSLPSCGVPGVRISPGNGLGGDQQASSP
jgi:hypothetical protein